MGLELYLLFCSVIVAIIRVRIHPPLASARQEAFLPSESAGVDPEETGCLELGNCFEFFAHTVGLKFSNRSQT